ncbi:TetR family transcriptional regulator [Vibrio maerlii]|uniref:TetR family transcriptional regulator n=1 Tax=Vibrio maerlii TaxID=2231648 RepID=UPI000E3BB292|nr:TetR family transcriptional regulator [Vibrio maerlii]
MARITREARAQKKQALDDIVWQVFRTEGWNAVTYQRVATEIGGTKSTIQRYYPTRMDFLEAIEGRTFPLFADRFDKQCPERFLQSWIANAVDPLFRNTFELIVKDSLIGLNGRQAQAGLKNLRKFITKHFGAEQTEPLTKRAIGGLMIACIDTQVAA